MYLHIKRCLDTSICRQIKVIYFGTEGVHLLLYYYKNVRQLMTHNKPFKGSKIEGGKSYTMRVCDPAAAAVARCVTDLPRIQSPNAPKRAC